ncbi:H-NS family nucleoid-associated regulatory protein [Cupriavidus consociatus]|uniref:H-NS histone family protein n=1 Tax=Cupriavidus consociatus TaxID=2821357 RepID=UPI001AE9BD12|nr:MULTISPECIES: H-NS histone family protein [unclassified Cupriavidus]MBP0622441.1 H-NS histone family protein [Cupriavidus sp. LEh25]MDK2659127.1 H-NS histone family protein [Cupriavidus sp. LEh21]
MATYQELLAQKQALEAQIEQARATEVPGVLEQIRALMQQYSLSPEDIAPRRRRGGPTAAVTGPTEKAALPPKYQDPKTGKTWSGRGRAPAWLGKRPARFLIPQE